MTKDKGASLRDRATREPSRSVSALRAGIASAAILLAGCNPIDGQPLSDDELSSFSGMSVWTDPDTGCAYLLYVSSKFAQNATGGLSIRFRSDGTPDCPGTTPEQSQ